MDKITIERETLLPCPFCGDDGDKGRQEVTQMIEGRNKFARVTCRACGAMCPEENWNRRAALAAQPAEAQQEPVAHVGGDEARRFLVWSQTVAAFDYPIGTPVYAARPAPAAVPLTDEQIDHTLATTLDEFARTTRGMSHALDVNTDIAANSRLRRMFARAIERAHGIAAAGDKV